MALLLHQIPNRPALRFHAAVAPLLVLGLGCSDWPRALNPPATVGSSAVGTSDARFSWQMLDYEKPDAPNDLPNGDGVVGVTLGGSAGARMPGVLRGIGWQPDEPPEQALDPACPEAGGPLSISQLGYYIGDVDFWAVETAVSGLVCFSASTDSVDVGWDLVAWRLDDCGLPVELVSDEQGPLGRDLGGRSGQWETVLEAGNYGVAIAGYAPDDVVRDVPYTLSVALDATGPCPAPPELVVP